MPCQNLLHQFDSAFGTFVRKSHNTGMRFLFGKYQTTEVGIDSNQNTILRRSESQQILVTRIWPEATGLQGIVALRLQPFRQTPAGATIYQELHGLATSTASRESLATTAWA